MPAEPSETALVMYGIANCDTVRRARRELEAARIPHRFHDFRRDGLNPETLDHWLAAVGWENLLNRRGTTWRNLTPGERESMDAARAHAAMLVAPALIRRPVVEAGDQVLVGWDDSRVERIRQALHGG